MRHSPNVGDLCSCMASSSGKKSMSTTLNQPSPVTNRRRFRYNGQVDD